MHPLVFALAAALAFAAAYRVSDRDHRQTLRYAAVTVLWTASICLIIAWS